MGLKFLISLLLAVCLSSGSAFADGVELAQKKNRKQKRSLTIEDNPLPRGGGKIAGGIVTMSVGTGVGLLVFLSQLFAYCGENDGSSEYSSCENDKRNMNYLGGGLIVVGLSVGIPFTVMGAKERREWKQWNRENVKGYALHAPDVDEQMHRDAARFVRANSAKHGPALSLISYNF